MDGYGKCIGLGALAFGLLVCCGCSEGAFGSLVAVSNADVGVCPGGGAVITTGLDNGDGGGQRDDGVLQPGEVDHVEQLCNGVAGASSLVQVAEEPPGENCPNGGYRVDSGLDDGQGGGNARDGTLSPEEIDSTSYICDSNRRQVARLTRVSSVAGDDDCPSGWLEIEMGADADGDEVLSAGEVEETFFACNRAPAISLDGLYSFEPGAIALAVSVVDPEKTGPVSIQWLQRWGPPIAISNSQSLAPSFDFVEPVGAEILVDLVAADSLGATARATTSVRMSGCKAALGLNHTCAIRSNGTLWCWGSDLEGQIAGTGDTSAPIQVGTDDDWIDITAGDNHTCGIRRGGALYCWGANDVGQLGDGTLEGRSAPTAIAISGDWVQVEAGASDTCAIMQDGTLWCWGGNHDQVLFPGDSVVVPEPLQVGSRNAWARLSSGTEARCVRDQTGELWCWGRNFHGQLGFELPTLSRDRQNVSQPAQTRKEGYWTSIAFGERHFCGIRSNGSLWCWGNGSNGALADGTLETRSWPLQVGIEVGWERVASGADGGCGVRDGGELWCWGANFDGQVGNGEIGGEVFSPVRIGADSDWVDVARGAAHSCAWRSSGALWCWGRDDFGQVGNEGPVDDGPHESPTEILSAL